MTPNQSTMRLDMLLLQWPILIVARLLQIASHEYDAYIKPLRTGAIRLEQIKQLANAGSLYNPNLLVNGFLSDIGGSYGHVRTALTIQRARNELYNVFDEALRNFNERHLPDMVIDVLTEIDEMFEWELYLQDDINEIQCDDRSAVVERLRNRINAVPNALINAKQQACYTTHRKAECMHEADERTVLDLKDISNALSANMEVWCIDFLNPIYETGDVSNAAILDAIQQPRTLLLSTKQQATLNSLTNDLALAISVVVSILYFDMNDEDWVAASSDVSTFIRTIALRAAKEIESLLQRQSSMTAYCDARSILQVLNKAHVVFH